MTSEKVTFTLPEELVRKLEKIPQGKRSLLVAKALKKELDRKAAVESLKRLRRSIIWKEKNHLDLLSPEDFARYRPTNW